jgi:hypothetical protein
MESDRQKSLGRVDNKRANFLGVHIMYSSQYIHNESFDTGSLRLFTHHI